MKMKLNLLCGKNDKFPDCTLIIMCTTISKDSYLCSCRIVDKLGEMKEDIELVKLTKEEYESFKGVEFVSGFYSHGKFKLNGDWRIFCNQYNQKTS